MRLAIEEYKKGGIGIRQLSRAWNVPKSTLQRRVTGKVEGFLHASGRKSVFAPEQERELADILKSMARRGFPLVGAKVRKLAYQYAEKQGINNQFSEHRGTAGVYWLNAFLSRNGLSLRKPEALSVGRASGMNETVVGKWFADVKELMDELGVRDRPSQLWNCDETGLQEHFVQGTVIGETGQPCYQITGTEKGETTTVLACFNALGQYCPPMIIFKGKRLNADWLIGSPANAVVKVSPNGWITAELFLEWARHFVACLPTGNSNPHILFLDGHSSHTYNLEFIDMMKANNVHPVVLPPHTTHWLQPADKAFFKSLKSHWTKQGIEAVTKVGGRTLGKKSFFALFTPAWTSACNVR